MTPTEVHDLYTQLWNEHGATSAGVGWGSEPEHHARLSLAAEEVLRTAGDVSVLDVGCGYGELLHYLTLPNYGIPFNAQGEVKFYLGLDTNPAVIEYWAQQLEGKGRATFRQDMYPVDIIEYANTLPDLEYKWTAVVGIGVLAWYDYATATHMLEAMWKLTDFCLVFTVNTKTSIGLTPQNVMGVLKSLGVSHYRMLHDYGVEYDYMFVCRRYKDKV